MSCCREMSCISSRTGTTEGFPTLITTRSNPPHWSKSRGPWTRNTRNSRSTTTSYRAILAATRRNSRSRGLARLVSHCPSRPRRRAVQVGIAARAGGVRHQSSLSAQGQAEKDRTIAKQGRSNSNSGKCLRRGWHCRLVPSAYIHRQHLVELSVKGVCTAG
jgi:hypothetical protein